MLVKEWMSKKVITIDASETLSEAINTLKRNKIRRLPVLENGKLVGIASDRDLKEAAPSRATSLDIWELHYLMSRIKVKDVMTRGPITINQDATIEKAAIIMKDNVIGGLPVVGDQGSLVGIITEQDIFEALIHITGVRHCANRVSVVIADEPGTVKDVCDILRKYDAKCVSILTTNDGIPQGSRKVIIRFQAKPADIPKAVKDLENKYEFVAYTKD